MKEVVASLPNFTDFYPVLKASIIFFRQMVKTPSNLDLLKKEAMTIMSTVGKCIASFPKLVGVR